MSETKQPLEGIRVLDASTLFAGPLAATILSDFGAETFKIEHPRGDPGSTPRLQQGRDPLVVEDAEP